MAEQNFPTGTLMAGKRGLIMGVANKNSIAWAIARPLPAKTNSQAALLKTQPARVLNPRLISRPIALSMRAAAPPPL